MQQVNEDSFSELTALLEQCNKEDKEISEKSAEKIFAATCEQIVGIKERMRCLLELQAIAEGIISTTYQKSRTEAEFFTQIKGDTYRLRIDDRGGEFESLEKIRVINK